MNTGQVLSKLSTGTNAWLRDFRHVKLKLWRFVTVSTSGRLWLCDTIYARPIVALWRYLRRANCRFVTLCDAISATPIAALTCYVRLWNVSSYFVASSDRIFRCTGSFKSKKTMKMTTSNTVVDVVSYGLCIDLLQFFLFVSSLVLWIHEKTHWGSYCIRFVYVLFLFFFFIFFLCYFNFFSWCLGHIIFLFFFLLFVLCNDVTYDSHQSRYCFWPQEASAIFFYHCKVLLCLL